MSPLSPQELAGVIGQGLLTFPVTHFDGDLEFDEGAYRAHCNWLIEHPFAAMFAAGGTGEFFSLTPTEVERVTRAAIVEIGSKVPVLSAAGYGTAIACDMARTAEKCGAQGLLLLPPYLVRTSQEGLAAHVSSVCRSTGLAVIFYARDNSILDAPVLAKLCDQHPNLVGYKDGIGDLEHFASVQTLINDRLTYIGGLPTAETFAPAYLEMGCTTYSSAIANFIPEAAVQFFEAVRSQDKATTSQILRDFILPYAAIRRRKAGYPVSIVKAGMSAVGRSAGPVRPPLTDLTEADFADLVELLARLSKYVGK